MINISWRLVICNNFRQLVWCLWMDSICWSERMVISVYTTWWTTAFKHLSLILMWLEWLLTRRCLLVRLYVLSDLFLNCNEMLEVIVFITWMADRCWSPRLISTLATPCRSLQWMVRIWQFAGILQLVRIMSLSQSPLPLLVWMEQFHKVCIHEWMDGWMDEWMNEMFGKTLQWIGDISTILFVVVLLTPRRDE